MTQSELFRCYVTFLQRHANLKVSTFLLKCGSLSCWIHCLLFFLLSVPLHVYLFIYLFFTSYVLHLKGGVTETGAGLKTILNPEICGRSKMNSKAAALSFSSVCQSWSDLMTPHWKKSQMKGELNSSLKGQRDISVHGSAWKFSVSFHLRQSELMFGEKGKKTCCREDEHHIRHSVHTEDDRKQTSSQCDGAEAVQQWKVNTVRPSSGGGVNYKKRI